MKRYDEYKETNQVWLPFIPKHWDTIKIKYQFDEISDKNHADEIPLVASQHMGVVPKSIYGLRTVEATKGLDLFKRVMVGDFVISLRSFQGGLEFAYYQGIISPAYTILRCKNNEFNQYYRYLFKSAVFIKLLTLCVTGIREGQNIDYATLKQFSIPVPPSSEQDQIVRYLDWQTSRINKLIKGYKRQIELLEEKKRTVTFYSVVYGLNHNIEMKESIIPWIDHIPAHWSVKNLAQLFTQVKCKNTNLQEKNLLSLSYGKIKRRNIDATEGLLPESFEGYNIIEKDDIVLRLTDLQNDHKSLRTGISTERGIVTSAYVTIRNFSENNPQYLHYYLHAFDLNKGFYNVGASGVRQSLNWDNIRTLPILLPPLNEQNQIVDHINTIASKIDEAKKTYEKTIELFLEYRTRLISDVVTGQIDVRDIQIPEYIPEEETEMTDMEVEKDAD